MYIQETTSPGTQLIPKKKVGVGRVNLTLRSGCVPAPRAASRPQRFRGQVGPILELMKCNFFPLKIIFIDYYVTTTTYK